MRYKLIVLACAFASAATAQLGSYLGPGVMTHGAGDIGTRAGEPVTLRFYADVSGIYESGIQPVSLDSKGNLVQVSGLYGVEAGIGVYGVHYFRRAQLGLDYRGTFRHYSQNTFYDGSDHQLILGYTYQKSKRLYFDMREQAGTLSRSIGGIPGVSVGIPSVVDQPISLLFDNRMNYSESSLMVTYLLTARTSISGGGEGYLVRRQSEFLIGMNGYSLRGTLQHRLSRVTSIGAAYEHQHFDYPGQYGQADLDGYQGIFATRMGRRWTFSMRAGVYRTQIQGVQQVALDPDIARILGITSTPQTFYQSSTFPIGTANLRRQFKTSALSLEYGRTISPGNGVYLTSRNESATVSYNYTGIRKASFDISGGESSLVGLGQSLPGYRQWTGSTGLTYRLGRSLHFIARYDARHQAIDLAGYLHTSYRATIGLAFSPGTVPLSLW